MAIFFSQAAGLRPGDTASQLPATPDAIDETSRAEPSAPNPTTHTTTHTQYSHSFEKDDALEEASGAGQRRGRKVIHPPAIRVRPSDRRGTFLRGRGGVALTSSPPYGAADADGGKCLRKVRLADLNICAAAAAFSGRKRTASGRTDGRTRRPILILALSLSLDRQLGGRKSV